MPKTETTPWGAEREVIEPVRPALPTTRPWEDHVPCSPEEVARIEKEYEAKHG